MFVCVCNPFSDKDVKAHCAGCPKPCRLSDTYKACSGGANPNCARCLPHLKAMLAEINAEKSAERR